MFANVCNPQDAKLFAKPFAPGIAILSINHTLSRADIISLLSVNVPPAYHKKIMTISHTAIGGVTGACPKQRA
jgi:hypothetical protein